MTVESLDAGEQLAVVAARDQDLGVTTDGRLKEREGTRSKLVLLELGDFILAGLLSVGSGGRARRDATGKGVRQLVAGLAHKLPDFFVSTCARSGDTEGSYEIFAASAMVAGWR